MDQITTLRRYGLFDAKVPRYTSYPPANRFSAGVGALKQSEWLQRVPPNKPMSIYVHIPFCRRLCWFCACRTQGTKTLASVENYLNVLLEEIATTARTHLSGDVPMRRLHLGGGTPTLLNGALMDRLLDLIFGTFTPTKDFEFSVEIDPTEAAPDVLDTLARRNMARASVGVQDFDPQVQRAIGRLQSFDDTNAAINTLRKGGVGSLNVDLLYGLPFQAAESLVHTLDRVVSLRPDRLALYGYAHVPHMSKRQVMIPDEALPNAEQRFVMSQIARDRLVTLGYDALGIDHFALPSDSLSKAAKAGTMTRNFQGYTDDPCDTLIGFGASAISQFEDGFVQNAVSTSAYVKRVQETGLAGDKGIALTQEDRFIAALVNQIMCTGSIQFQAVKDRFPDRTAELQEAKSGLMAAFPELLSKSRDAVEIKLPFVAAARLIAAHLDNALSEPQSHSLAV